MNFFEIYYKNILQKPYDATVSKNLRLTGDEFVNATGYCMQVAYLHHALQQKNE